jgi:IS605 OrfB family transposase
VVVESDKEIKSVSGDVLGIDRGINNIAVTSANQFFNSKAVNNVRGKYAYLRRQLQSKGTRSAKRKLIELSGRERRFKADVNHCIAKEIVNSPYGAFVLEDLKGIRERTRSKKRGAKWSRNKNRKLGSWSFLQLEQFIEYKAEELGKRVLLVDPSFTSRRCSRCGDTKPENVLVKPDGSVFLIDFEQASQGGNKTWDVAVFLYYCGHYLQPFYNIAQAEWITKAFAAGYLKAGGCLEDIRNAGLNKYTRIFSIFTMPSTITTIANTCKKTEIAA